MHWEPNSNPNFFKNFGVDFDNILPISTILILISIFSWNFKILDLDIEATKPFLPLIETYQVGAHFEALIEGVLMAPLDPRYTQVGFNLICVQVCHAKVDAVLNHERDKSPIHHEDGPRWWGFIFG